MNPPHSAMHGSRASKARRRDARIDAFWLKAGIQFGIAAAEIETVTRRQFPVVEGTEKDQVRAGLLQDLEAVFIIETEGFARAMARTARQDWMKGRTARPGQRRCLAGTSQEFINGDGLFGLGGQGGHFPLEVSNFIGCDQSQMAAGKVQSGSIREAAQAFRPDAFSQAL